MARRVLLYLSDARLAKLGDRPQQAIYALIDAMPAVPLGEQPVVERTEVVVEAAVVPEVVRRDPCYKPLECRACRIAGLGCGAHK